MRKKEAVRLILFVFHDDDCRNDRMTGGAVLDVVCESHFHMPCSNIILINIFARRSRANSRRAGESFAMPNAYLQQLFAELHLHLY